MKVNQHRDLAAAAPVSRPAPRAKTNADLSTTDFTAAAQLTRNLAAAPEVRSSEVARAKALIANPNYPDTATIEKVAKQLAGKITRSNSAE